MIIYEILWPYLISVICFNKISCEYKLFMFFAKLNVFIISCNHGFK